MSLARSVSAALMLGLGGTGCSTYDPARHYDATASEDPAIIVEKRKFATKVQPAADAKTNMAFLYIPGATRIVMIALAFTLTNEAVIDVFEYTVETGDKRRTAVYSDYLAFEVGHCVTLLTSSKPSYPRISAVGRCP